MDNLIKEKAKRRKSGKSCSDVQAKIEAGKSLINSNIVLLNTLRIDNE